MKKDYYFLKNIVTNEISYYKKEDFLLAFGGEFEHILSKFRVSTYLESGIQIPIEDVENIFFMDFVSNWNTNTETRERLGYEAIYFSDLTMEEQTKINNSINKKAKNGSPKTKGNGEGTLYWSKALQKWVGQYVDIDGKRQTMTQKKNEKPSDFKKRFNAVLVSLDNGTYIKKSKDTLYQILKRYIEQKFKDGITSPRSYQRNLETLKQIEVTCKDFINKPIQKVVVENIEDAKPLIREYAPTTIDKIWGMLNVGFKIANSRRKITFNIMDDVNLTKPISIKTTKVVPSLSVKEEKKLRSILNNEEKDHPYRDIALLQLNTGMRIGEVLARSINDFDKKSLSLHIWNTLTQDKNYKVILGEHTKIYDKKNNIDKGERTIPLDKESIEIFSRRTKSKIKNIHNLLFWDYESNFFITPGEINSWIKRLNQKYKITDKDLTTHVLRHTRATRMREAGISLPVIQYFLGHVEGSKVTDAVYISVSFDFVNKELKKANFI